MRWDPFQLIYYRPEIEVFPRDVSVPPFICSAEQDHQPVQWRKRRQFKEWFFHAAKQGCLPCVRHCIEVLCIDPDVQSDHERHTALAWSEWAAGLQVDGAREVFEYLSNRPFVRRGRHLRLDPFRGQYVVTIIESGPRSASDSI